MVQQGEHTHGSAWRGPGRFAGRRQTLAAAALMAGKGPVEAALTSALRGLARARPAIFERLGEARTASFVIVPTELPIVFRLEPDAAAATPAGVQVLRLYGALFFGAVAKVEAVAEQLPEGTHTLVMEMNRLVLMDASGLDALEQLHRLLARQQIRLLLCELNEQPQGLIERSGFAELLGRENLHPDLAAALRAIG